MQRNSCGLVYKELSISKVSLAIKFKWKVAAALSIALYFAEILFFNILPKTLSVCVRSWHKFRCCRNQACAFSTIHEQPFTLPHNFIAVVWSVILFSIIDSEMLQRNLLPLLKLWYLSTKLQSFILQKTIFSICQDSQQSSRNWNTNM